MNKVKSYFLLLGAMFLLSACASTGSHLQPGVATLPEIIAAMGEPQMRWKDADGQEQLAFPHGPAGVHTYMAFVGADGRLIRVAQVLDEAHFALIQIGKSTREDVLRLIGPPYPGWTVENRNFNEVSWEWNYLDRTNQIARLNVFFDMTTGIVRDTWQRTLDVIYPRVL